MKFLIDQDVYATTSEFLKNLGHDVVKAAERGLARAPDRELLRIAHVDERVLVTRDKDFGALSFLETKASSGVILLRLQPRTLDIVHVQFERLLLEQDAAALMKSFAVVEAAGYRIRALPC